MLSALVFCNRKRDVSALNKALQKRGLASAELHGDMPQSSRMETLENFKKGEIRILACSDVAARGLDMPKVSHVFNYDVPNHAEDYVHRIGRTGRAGRSGKAFMLATPADGKSLAAIERAMNRAIPTVELDSVRILKPQEVEGELPAAEEKFGDGGAAAQPAAASGEPDAQQAEADGGKSKSGKRRRRGGRSKSKKPAEADQPQQAAENQAPETQAPEIEAPETEAPETEAPETLAPQAKTADRVDGDDSSAQPATANDAGGATAVDPADAQAGESSDAQPAAGAQTSGEQTSGEQTSSEQAGGKSKGRSRNRRGGKKAKQSDKPAATGGDQPQTDDQPAVARGEGAQPQPAQARAQNTEQSGSQKGAKDKRGERVDQASNGKQSKPFGDHTPAFLLKPVPQRATA